MCARTRSAVRWWIGRTNRSIPLRHRNACSTKRQSLVRPHPVGRRQPLGRLAGPDHIDPIQKLFVIDRVFLAGPPQMAVADRQGEMFGHLVMVDDLARPHADRGRRLGSARRRATLRGQRLQFGLRGREQVLALLASLLGQLGVVAGHQPFVGEFRRGDLRQAFGLQVLPDQAAVGQQPADRPAPQRRDPAQSRVFLEHINLSLCEHAAIADQHHPRQAEPLRERLDLIGDGLGIAGVAGIDRARRPGGRRRRSARRRR